MEAEVLTIEQLATDFTLWLTPLFMACLALILVLLLKDAAMSIAKGIRFKMHPAFKEGDHVYLDGEKAVIVKMGLFTSVFGIESDRGYCWRYIANERIGMARIEKIIHKPRDLERISQLNRRHDDDDK